MEHFHKNVWEAVMDRRQRKTREAIFNAFIELLSNQHYNQITVGDIIDKADIGRATFYAHFETKDYLLKEMCEELFCHLFDNISNESNEHHHIFVCDSHDTVFLHLLKHIQKNENNILKLLSSQNNDLFLKYFKKNIIIYVSSNLSLFPIHANSKLPDSFWINHICVTFVETIKWWINNGMKESPNTISEYFYDILYLK